MASFVRYNRVKCTTTTTGTGTLTLGSAVTGFVAPSAVYSNGDTGLWVCEDSPTPTNWEVFYGTYTSSGTTLSRDQVICSSNSNALVNFSAGTKNVYPAYTSGEASSFDSSVFGSGVDGDVTISSGTTTLTRDMYYNTLTITGTTSKISTNGYRILVKDKLDISGYTGSGPVFDNSGSGSTAAASNTMTGPGAGAGGGAGSVYATATSNGSNGSASSATAYGLGGRGGNGGSGGNGYGYTGLGSVTPYGGSGGSGGTSGTIQNTTVMGWFNYKPTHNNNNINAGTSGAGGGGGAMGSNYYNDGKSAYYYSYGSGGSGGNGGAGGGCIFICARFLITGASTPAGSFTANAGNGSAGSNYASVVGTNIAVGAGGGGGGGGGGWILLGYYAKFGSAVTNLLKANGGNGAAGGTGYSNTPNSATSPFGGAGGAGGAGGGVTLVNFALNTITTTSGSAGSSGGNASGTTAGTAGTGGTCQVTL